MQVGLARHAGNKHKQCRALARAIADRAVPPAHLADNDGPRAGDGPDDEPATGWTWPPDRPSDAALDAAAVQRILDALPWSYRLRLLQAAARAAAWKGPIPDPGQVLQHGIEWLCRPGVGPLTAWREHRQHEQHRALAHAVAARAAALAQHIDGPALTMLDADGVAILAEAERRARAAQAKIQAARTKKVAFDPETGEIYDQPRIRLAPRPLTPDERRDMCPRAQRRRVRREIDRTDAHVSAVLGIVGGRRPPKGQPDNRQLYVSDWTLARWRQRRDAGRDYMASRLIVDKNTGKTICTAAEAKDSADKHRRATMVALVHGLREAARRDGLVPVAVTLTLPGKYHPNPSKGEFSHDPGLSPADAFREIQACWHRVVVLLRKRGVRVFGIWLPEPHEDGCPHRHAILWCDPARSADLESAVRRHFPGPGDVAAKFRWLTERNSAAVETYVLCYALKMTVEAPSSKAEAPDGEEHLAGNFDRFLAWKSVHGSARSWGFIGLARGTITRFRDLYKLAVREEKGEEVACARTRVILRAIRKRQHATALRLMGAFSDTEDRRKREPMFKGVYEDRTTEYGDTARVKVGLQCVRSGYEATAKRPGLAIMTESQARTLAERLGTTTVSEVVSSPRVGADAPPRPSETTETPTGPP